MGFLPFKKRQRSTRAVIQFRNGLGLYRAAKYKNSTPCGVQELLDGVADMLMATVEDFVFC